MTPVPDPLQDKLSELYHQVPPPPEGLAAGRDRFLAEAARLRDTAGRPATLTARMRRIWIQPVFRFASLALIAILAFFALGGGLVHLAEASLPGDLLYPVKLAYEDLRLSLINDPAEGTEESLQFAAKRVDEMRGLTERGSAIPDTVVDRLVRQMDQALERTGAASPEDAPLLMEQFQQTMRLQQAVLEQLQEADPAGSQTPVQNALQAVQRAYSIVDAAKGDPKRVQDEWQYQVQPETPVEGVESPYQHENQNQNQIQQPEPAGPPADDQLGPPPAPGADERSEGSEGHSGKSDQPRPSVTPSPGKNGR